MDELQVNQAIEKFEILLRKQLERVERITTQKSFLDFNKLDKIVIGVIGGDGIGPSITKAAQDVIEFILIEEVKKGRIEFRNIQGLTIENRLEQKNTIPDDVLKEIKNCHILLKGPTTTPDASYNMPNMESANVAMRKELDLFCNMRPVKVPSEGIDWIFFRENTEGSYAVGNEGINVSEQLAVDFAITTTEGSERIAKLAYEHAKKMQRERVSIVTKANVIKTTDGKFLNVCKKIGEEYPEIITDDWYIDIMTAKLIDPKRRRDFKVFILPNLYGDIITDEAAEFQGGVGTAGSANIGKEYAMFEAIHGSAPRMVKEGRAQYADPCSMLRAAVMSLVHMGYIKEAEIFEKALDICMYEERKVVVTGRSDGATCNEFAKYVMDTVVMLVRG